MSWQIREQAGYNTQFASMSRVTCRWGDGLNSMRQGLWQAGLTRLKVKEHVENLEAFPVSARSRENPQCSVIRGFQGPGSTVPRSSHKTAAKSHWGKLGPADRPAGGQHQAAGDPLR